MTKVVKNSISLKLKELVYVGWPASEKTRGEKMKVTSIILLKTNWGKMPEIMLSIMLLKNKQVIALSPLC
jgi:hypothetical protein